MTISGDTDDILDTDLWGEQVTVRRLAVTYGGDGTETEVWSDVVTPNADIQPLSGSEVMRNIGEERMTSHKIFFPASTNIRQGDRVRPYGWSTGDDEYTVEAVLAREDHVEVLARIVKGHV